MKNKITIHREYDESITESVTCDICKHVYKGTDWERERFSALETEIKMRTGYAYSGSEGSGEQITFDVCPKCFQEKLIPALRELGAEPTITEWEWE